jgi:hypothetical protein
MAAARPASRSKRFRLVSRNYRLAPKRHIFRQLPSVLALRPQLKLATRLFRFGAVERVHKSRPETAPTAGNLAILHEFDQLP